MLEKLKPVTEWIKEHRLILGAAAGAAVTYILGSNFVILTRSEFDATKEAVKLANWFEEEWPGD